MESLERDWRGIRGDGDGRDTRDGSRTSREKRDIVVPLHNRMEQV